MPSRQRVGLLALAGLGGSSKVAWELGRGLHARGHGVRMFTASDAAWRDDGTPLPMSGVPVPHHPTAAAASWVRPLAAVLTRQLREHPVDVLSVHYACGLAEAAVLACAALPARERPKLTVTLHGTDVSRLGRDPEQASRMRCALARAQRVTAVSGWLRDEALATLGLRHAPEVIPNGVDTERFSPASAPLAVEVCHVSNFRAVKRPLDCIDIFADLRACGCADQLWMVGEGPLLPDATGKAAELGLASCVHFPGASSPRAVAARLRDCSLAFVTSETEAFCLVALEAMASGCVPLVSDCGGLRELLAAEPLLLEHCLVAVGDIDAFAARAHRLLHEPARYRAVRGAGLRLARARLCLATMLDRYESLFGQVCTTYVSRERQRVVAS